MIYQASHEDETNTVFSGFGPWVATMATLLSSVSLNTSDC